MNPLAKEILITGNHAAAYGAKLARPQVIPVYPITPQTPVLEKIADFQQKGELAAELITVESEHSAMAGCISASLAGARVFTATSSQGLLLMHEMLHYAAGARAPVVMVNVNRTIASPWGFWPDHLDSLAQRDTGWIQLYCEGNQEILDTVIMAYRIAEAVSLPALVVYEAFYISHSLEPVKIPEASQVDKFLPPYRPAKKLDINNPSSFGNVVSQEMWQRHRRQMGAAMEKALVVAEVAESDWSQLVGREYGILESYRCEGAELVLVTMGGPAGTCREAVDLLRREGIKAGMLKVRLFRPFPVQAIRAALKDVPVIAVLDRNYCVGMGGILHQEVKAALAGVNNNAKIHGFLVGVGGTDIAPETITKVARQSLEEPALSESVWVG